MKQILKKFCLGAILAIYLTHWLNADSNTFPQSGNVGIGTATPSGLLEIKGSGEGSVVIPDSQYILGIGSNSDGYELNLTGGRATSPTHGARIRLGGGLRGDGENGTIQFFNGMQERMRLSMNGYVGIGTQNPRSLLEIRGPLLSSQPGSRLDLATFSAPTANDDRLELFMRRTAMPSGASGGWDTNEIWLQRAVDTSPMAYIKFTDHDLALGAGNQDSLYINSSGKIGIKTSMPDALLTIQGDGSVPLALNVGGSSNGRLRVRHIEGKSHLSADLDSLFLQHDVNYNTYINCGSSTGNVSIGTWTSTHKLNVNGAVRAKEVIVDAGWADDVFDSNYKLAPLTEVKNHIAKNGHLPGMPSAREVALYGVSVGETQSILLRKIEELTLHAIQQQELLTQQAQEIQKMRDQLQVLQSKVK